MRTPAAAAACGLLGLWLVPAAIAQPAASPSWDDLRASNPPATDLSLRLTEPRRYREGESIHAEVRFSAPSLNAPSQEPRRELWQFAGFLLDPAADCGALAAPCYSRSRFGGASGGFGPPEMLIGQTSSPVALTLNGYLPRLRPGHYRTAILVRRLTIARRTYEQPNPPQYAISNAVEIEVDPASEAWRKQVIAASASVLKTPPTPSSATHDSPREAARQLSFLDTPAAWRMSLQLLPTEEYTLLEGLDATRHPAPVCALMQAAIPSPSQVVSSRYMSALADICARANLPPAPPAQPSPEQAIAKANASLAASVARKQGEAKAIAFEVLIDSVTQIRAHVPPLPLPAWVPAVKAEFEKSYARIEGYRQRQLLGRFANILRPPELVPLLEGVMDAWSLGGQPMDARAALRSLYLIDPARAQARILAELAKQRTWLDAPLFDLLPPARAPITDDELIQDLAAGGNSPLEMTALAKYASPQALPRIRAIYESQRDSCQPELMAYFVRVDPEYADRVFHSHPWEMHAAPPACTARYFETTPRIAAGPVLERYMIAYLMHEDPRLKVAAARSLARFGSPAALAPLWDAFRYFHDYWKGKTQELAQTGAGRGLEDELRDAVARGRHWLVTEADLRVIQSLCISDYCRDSTEIDLGALQMPVKIQMGSQAGEAQGQVAQYAFESMEELEEKLSQFPKGTPFSLHAFGEGAGEAAIRIRDYAAAHGLTVALQ